MPEGCVVDTDVVSYLLRGDTRAAHFRPYLKDTLTLHIFCVDPDRNSPPQRYKLLLSISEIGGLQQEAEWRPSFTLLPHIFFRRPEKSFIKIHSAAYKVHYLSKRCAIV